MKKNAGGRPRHGELPKAPPISFRTEQDLRAQLDNAAETNGVTLTREIERRLRLSFEKEAAVLPPDLMEKVRESAAARGAAAADEIADRVRQTYLVDQLFDGSHTARLLRMIGAAIGAAEGRTSNSWSEDPITWQAAFTAAMAVMRANMPPYVEPALAEKLAECRAKIADLEARLSSIEEELTGFMEAHPILVEVPNKMGEGMTYEEVEEWLGERVDRSLVEKMAALATTGMLVRNDYEAAKAELEILYRPVAGLADEGRRIGNEVADEIAETMKFSTYRVIPDDEPATGSNEKEPAHGDR